MSVIQTQDKIRVSDDERGVVVRTRRDTHRLEMVDIVDGEILRDVKQQVVREGVERHDEKVWWTDGRRSGLVVVEEERGSSGIWER